MVQSLEMEHEAARDPELDIKSLFVRINHVTKNPRSFMFEELIYLLSARVLSEHAKNFDTQYLNNLSKTHFGVVAFIGNTRLCDRNPRAT